MVTNTAHISAITLSAGLSLRAVYTTRTRGGVCITPRTLYTWFALWSIFASLANVKNASWALYTRGTLRTRLATCTNEYCAF